MKIIETGLTGPSFGPRDLVGSNTSPTSVTELETYGRDPSNLAMYVLRFSSISCGGDVSKPKSVVFVSGGIGKSSLPPPYKTRLGWLRNLITTSFAFNKYAS